MNANLYIIEDYENETAFRPKKTNPIQTKSCQACVVCEGVAGLIKGQNERKIACRKIRPRPPAYTVRQLFDIIVLYEYHS